MTKKIELVSKHIKKAKKSNTNENVKQHRFQSYHRIDRTDSDASQDAIQRNNRNDDRDRDNYRKRDKENRDDKLNNDTNRSQVKC